MCHCINGGKMGVTRSMCSAWHWGPSCPAWPQTPALDPEFFPSGLNWPFAAVWEKDFQNFQWKTSGKNLFSNWLMKIFSSHWTSPLARAFNCFSTGNCCDQRIQSYIGIFCAAIILPDASKAGYRLIFDENNVCPSGVAIITSLLTWLGDENYVLIPKSKWTCSPQLPDAVWPLWPGQVLPLMTSSSSFPMASEAALLFVFIYSFILLFPKYLFP